MAAEQGGACCACCHEQAHPGHPAAPAAPGPAAPGPAAPAPAASDEDDGAPCACCASADAPEDDGSRRRALLMLVACAVPTLASAALHIGGAAGPFLTPLTTVLAVLGSVVGLVIIAPAVRGAVVRRSIDINILMAIAVVGAWLLGDFVEAAAVVLFFCVGEWLEDFAIERNRSSIERLMDLTPQVVRVRRGGETLELAPEAVPLGSIVAIRAGDRIPLDGTVVSGGASVDESPITGESVPVLKQEGDAVYAGSLSVDGKLEFATTATVADSTLARIVALVEESQGKRTPYERFINRFAKYYTPLVVAIAALVALVPTTISLLTPLDLGGIGTWGYRALALLVIACPCALVIATPVSVVTGLSRAARMGVLVKGGAFLELGSKVRAIAFDKTGTLTYGRPEVVGVELLGASAAPAADAPATGGSKASGASLGAPVALVAAAAAPAAAPPPPRPAAPAPASPEAVLALAAALEQDSAHPLARAVVAAVQDKASVPQAEQVAEVAGQGISGVVGGVAVTVGSPSYAFGLAGPAPREALIGSPSGAQALDRHFPEARERVAALEATAATVLVVLADTVPVGLIAVRDVVRTESAALLGRLQGSLGMHTVMLTGDNAATAQAVAREAGIGQVFAGLLPREKMGCIEDLKREYGTVAMVGDGINDAPALALADVGIAMGAASSDTAIQVADVALMASNIEVLPAFFRLARKVVATIHTNIAFALAVKAAVMVLAVLGIAQMWMAIFADVGVLVLVILYSMRLGLTARRSPQTGR